MITKENWLEKWALIPASVDKTPAEILSLNTPQLSQLGKNTEGQMMGVTIFQAQIASLIGFTGAQWAQHQIDEAGELAYQECYWFSLAELKQFIVRVKSGRYRSNKNLTPAVFMEFLQDYSYEMHEARGQFIGQAKKEKKKRVLSIEPLKGKSRKVAIWILKQVEESNNAAMEQMRQLTESMYARQRELEYNERKETIDAYQNRMKILASDNKEVKALMQQGLSLDEAINELLNNNP